MKIVFNPDDLTFKLHYDERIEEKQANIYFERKIKDWQFKTKHIPGWNGDVQFINNFKLPAGLWGELKNMCTTYKFPLKVEGFNQFLRNDVEFADVKKFVDEKRHAYNATVSDDKKFKERPYQAKAVYLMIKYRLCMLDLATAAGKTWIMFLYAAWMKIHGQGQILSIEPDPDYVLQVFSEVTSFANATRTNIKLGAVSGSSSLKDISEYDYIVGNFQTLGLREPEFFSGVRYIMADEGHKAKAKTIKNIMKMCPLAKDRIGLSGTVIADKTADHYSILAATGPVVIRVSKKDLMDAGYAPGIKILVYVLDYLSEDEKKQIAFLKESNTKVEIDQYNHELFVMRNNELRLDFIAKLIADLPMNSLTFFTDVQNEYGKKIYNAIRKKSHTKEVYYIDGSVADNMRDMYRKRMEEGNNKSLVATYGTYSTGKSIKNLHYLVGGEPVKSEIVVGQVIGRGMREFLDKDVFHWIDIVDDFRWTGEINDQKVKFNNILYRQSRDRIKIYEDEGFEYEVIKINLNIRQKQQHNLFN